MPIREITVLIAEDEAENRDFLKYILSQYPDFKVIGEATTGQELIDFYFELEPHVIFADIEMPEMDGMAAISKLTEIIGGEPIIVFITGHSEYAIDAYEFSAFDYILKPYKPERVKKTLEKVRARIQEKHNSLRPLLNTVHANSKLCIKIGTDLQFIDQEKIVYIEKEGKRTLIHTEHGKYDTLETINSLETRLDPVTFFRSHKCFLVNLKKVDKIVPWGKHSHLIRFSSPKAEVLISSNKLQDLQRRLQQF